MLKREKTSSHPFQEGSYAQFKMDENRIGIYRDAGELKLSTNSLY